MTTALLDRPTAAEPDATPGEPDRAAVRAEIAAGLRSVKSYADLTGRAADRESLAAAAVRSRNITYRVRVVHVSGRFDVPVARFASYVARVVRRHKADVFTTTETYGSLKPLRALLPDYAIAREGEYVVGFRRSTFNVTTEATLRRHSWAWEEHDDWRDLFSTRRRATHRAGGFAYLAAAAHAPSHVEMGDNLRSDSAHARKQVQAWTNGLDRIGDSLDRAERRTPGLVWSLGIDTNGDHHRKAWRNRTEEALDARSGWSERRPNRGTHGARLIDAIYSNRRVVDAGVSGVRPRSKRIDHVAVYGTVLVPA